MAMYNRHNQGRDSEARPGPLGSLLALVALLLYFLLPLLYYGHLANSPLPAASPDLKTAQPVVESQPQDPAPFHDRNTCPICQAASTFQDYGSSPSFHAPDSSFPVGLLADRDSTAGFACLISPTRASRAPPV